MENQKIGLALGGGAVLGAAHIGVLKAIEEFEIEVSYVCGTSIGAFVGAFYAFGKGWEEIQEIALQLRWMDVASISLSKYGLLTNEKIGTLITENLGSKRIEDANIPLSMIATDAADGERVVLSKGNVADSVMASTCIPGIFRPIDINDRLLIDGGIVENVPVKTLRDMGAEYAIGVDLNTNRSSKKPGNIVDVLLNSFHFIMKQSTSFQTQDADILIKPDLSSFSQSDTDKIKDLVAKGYEAACSTLEEMK